MPTPFPGMDPFLEDPRLWPDFHRQLATVLSHVATGGARYEVTVVARHYPNTAEELVEIRQRSDNTLVTLMDIVSPANKLTEMGRRAYLDHRAAAQQRQANLVEIDLVMQGRPLLDYSREGLPHWDQAVTVTRASKAGRLEIYTATLAKNLPKFRLPLAADDRDVVVDLQDAFKQCFERGGFSDRIDYKSDPAVALDENKLQWLDALLTGKGLRKPLPPHAHIAEVAYRIWNEEGKPHGRDREHWFKAIAELR